MKILFLYFDKEFKNNTFFINVINFHSAFFHGREDL